MKTLKITLFVALLFTVFTSCTKEDLTEDDVLTVEELYAGNADDQEGDGGKDEGDDGNGGD